MTTFKDGFNKDFSLPHRYIFSLFFIKSNRLPLIKVLWGLPINSLFNIKTIKLPLVEIALIYEVNTGKPIVAVVMRAPAKIKKGRKG